MSERVSSSTTYTPSRRLVKRLSAGVTALAVAHITIGVGAAAGDIPTPPRAKLNVYGLKVTGAWNPARGYCTISATASGHWKKAPERKGLTTGHYLVVKTEVIAPAGYGGSLTKTLATTRVTSGTYAIPHVGLPARFNWSAHFNAERGSGDYGARITVRVVRAVVGGLDTTAWKLVAKTDFRSGFCNSSTGRSR